MYLKVMFHLDKESRSMQGEYRMEAQELSLSTLRSKK